MKKWSLASIMKSKFKKIIFIFVIFLVSIVVILSFLLYTNFYESAQKDVYNDINFYFQEFDHDLSFSNINLIVKEQLNYLLSDKNTNVSLYKEDFAPYLNENNNLTDTEKTIFQKSVQQNKTLKEDVGFFTKNYYRAWSSGNQTRFIKIQVQYSLYKNTLYILFLILIFVLTFQLFLNYNFKKIIASVSEPITNLSEKMNNFKIKENESLSLDNSEIKEINDIQNNFKDMIEEININYEQLEAYNKEIINKNERLNEVNVDLDQSKRKYKNLFNNMLDGCAYYKIVYNEEMEAVDYTLLESNEAFEDIFNDSTAKTRKS